MNLERLHLVVEQASIKEKHRTNFWCDHEKSFVDELSSYGKCGDLLVKVKNITGTAPGVKI